MELINLKENIFYIKSRVNMGLIKTSESSAIIIDTGIDKDSAKKVSKILDEQHIKNLDIINTHSHTDHYGGNAELIRKFNSKVFVSEVEAAILNYPELEAHYLFSGAYPPQELRTKFLVGETSNADFIIKKSDKEISAHGETFGVINLLGHSFNQIGIAYKNILFIGDTLLDDEVLEKYKIPFLTNIEEYLKTLNFLETTNFEIYLGAHTKVLNNSDMKKSVQKHFVAVNKILEILSSYSNLDLTLDEVVTKLLTDYELITKNISEFFLMRSTIYSFISYLHQNKKINLRVKNNRLEFSS
ncbi:MAG: MBL fold metallo-hydrolase [Fusobacteriaceae bacterium]